MKEIEVDTWDQLRKWAEEAETSNDCVFRGQERSEWKLHPSLARYFLDSATVGPHEWRDRELEMYKMFREWLLEVCPGLYNDWGSHDILSLMQHHNVPTRMLDFTFSPWVAAFFALEKAKGSSAVWVVNAKALENMGFPHAGPTHDAPGYDRAKKNEGASVFVPRGLPRAAAQRSCFLVPGHISWYLDTTLTKHVEAQLIEACVTLSQTLVPESLAQLHGRSISREFLFPDLDAWAEEVKRKSIMPRPNEGA